MYFNTLIRAVASSAYLCMGIALSGRKKKEGFEEVGVPGGSFSFSFEAVGRSVLTQEAEHKSSQTTKVFRSMPLRMRLESSLITTFTTQCISSIDQYRRTAVAASKMRSLSWHGQNGMQNCGRPS